MSFISRLKLPGKTGKKPDFPENHPDFHYPVILRLFCFMKVKFFSCKVLSYRHFKICNFDTLCLKLIESWTILGHQTRLVFYLMGPTFIMHWETRGPLRSWQNSHFTISSIIERFPKKCCLRSTVQAGPILFPQVIGRLPRYVMLKYFWNWK